jgi:general secretion pathway protein H
MPGCVDQRFLSERSSAQKLAGFTLVELVVVLAMAAGLLAIAPGLLSKGVDAMAYRALVREIVTDLRATRDHALRSGIEARFFVDLPSRKLSAGRRTIRVADSLVVDAVLAASELTAPGVGAIVFYPDGSSTGGTIRVLRRDTGQGVLLRVDWLLGRVSQQQSDDATAS